MSSNVNKCKSLTAGGAAEFIPAPDETKRLISTYYAVKRNLLVR